MPWPAGLALGFLRGLSFEAVGDQVGVFPQTIGVTLNFDDDGVVQQAVQHVPAGDGGNAPGLRLKGPRGAHRAGPQGLPGHVAAGVLVDPTAPLLMVKRGSKAK